MYGLNQFEWQQLNELAISVLKSAGYELFLFGSRATRQHCTFSDIDILFRSAAPTDYSLIASVKAALEDSDLSVKVELVDWTELPDSFRAKIESEMIPL